MRKIDRLNIELVMATEEFNGRYAVIYDEKTALIRKELIFCIYCDRRSQLRRWSLVKQGLQCVSLFCPNCNKENFIAGHPNEGKITDLIQTQLIENKDLFDVIYQKSTTPFRLTRVRYE